MGVLLTMTDNPYEPSKVPSQDGWSLRRILFPVTVAFLLGIFLGLMLGYWYGYLEGSYQVRRPQKGSHARELKRTWWGGRTMGLD